MGERAIVVDFCKWKFRYCYAFQNMIPTPMIHSDCERCPFTEVQKKHEEWIAEEFKRYEGTMGSFHRYLCEAVTIADLKNTARLRRAYPFLVRVISGDSDKEE
jgi:glutathione S-transferase